MQNFCVKVSGGENINCYHVCRGTKRNLGDEENEEFDSCVQISACVESARSPKQLLIMNSL